MSARPHFSIAGIPVRVEPVFFVISALWGLQFLDNYFRVGDLTLKGGLDVVGLWMAATFVSILVHELGHGLALKAFGQRSAIVLHGFGGVTISQRRSQLSKSRSIIVSMAGSLTALIVLWLPMRQLSAAESIRDRPAALIWFFHFLAFQNLWWSIINLLPIRPLDGGNVTAELVGIDRARRISIVGAIGGAVLAFAEARDTPRFFALFLAFNNWQEIRAARVGADMDAFRVEAPEAGPAPPPRGRGHLSVVDPPRPESSIGAQDPTRTAHLAWAALREGDMATAKRLTAGLGAAADPYLKASTALATGDSEAFELFEAAYVGEPNGPPNLIATEVLARAGAAAAVARRLIDRSDGKGREGAGTLQTHLHYANRFVESAEVGEVVYAASPPSQAQTAFEVACSWAKAGDVDRAAGWLERAADAGFRAASVVDGEPDLATVRADPLAAPQGPPGVSAATCSLAHR